MDIEFLLQRLEKYILEECPKIPLSGNRTVNEEEVRLQLAQIQQAIPEEITRARQVLKQKEDVLAKVREEAAQVIADAQAEAQNLVGEHRIVQEAKQQSAVILQRAEREAVALRSEADEYAFDVLSQLQEELARSQRVVDNGLRKLEADRERRMQQVEKSS